MSYEIQLQSSRLIVALNGTIDTKDATNLRHSLFPLLHRELNGITFHLGGVTNMDSSGLGFLVAVQRMAAEANVPMEWVDASEALRARMVSVGLV